MSYFKGYDGAIFSGSLGNQPRFHGMSPRILMSAQVEVESNKKIFYVKSRVINGVFLLVVNFLLMHTWI